MFFSSSSSLYKLVIGFWFIFMSNSAVFAANGDKNGDKKDDSSAALYKILALGDSLTAGYGLPSADGFVPQMENWLNSQGLKRKIEIVNAGVSGDTTSGAQARLAWALAPFGPKGPDLVIVALGGNDGLRGVDPAVSRSSLTAIMTELKQKNIKGFIIGMQAPPNLGPDYAKAFNSIYPDLSAQFKAPLYPFFLDGVAAIKELNQKDGIHPNKKGVAIVVGKIGPVLKKAITGE